MNDHHKHNQNGFDTQDTTSSVIGFDDAKGEERPAKHTIYILVRTDIELHHQMVQAAHAAAEAGRRFYRDGHGIASLIVLAVPDKAALFKARERLAKKDIDTEMFFEPDFGIGESALGTQPLTNAQRKHLMGFPLWRAPKPAAQQPSHAKDLVALHQGSGGASNAQESATKTEGGGPARAHRHAHDRVLPHHASTTHLSRHAASALAA